MKEFFCIFFFKIQIDAERFVRLNDKQLNQKIFDGDAMSYLAVKTGYFV